MIITHLLGRIAVVWRGVHQNRPIVLPLGGISLVLSLIQREPPTSPWARFPSIHAIVSDVLLFSTEMISVRGCHPAIPHLDEREHQSHRTNGPESVSRPSPRPPRYTLYLLINILLCK